MYKNKRVVALISAIALIMSMCALASAEEAATYAAVNYVSYYTQDKCYDCNEIREICITYYINDDGSHTEQWECQECWSVFFSQTYYEHQQGGFVQLCQGCFDLYHNLYDFMCYSCSEFTSYDSANFTVADNNYKHEVIIDCIYCSEHIVTFEKLCTSTGQCGTCEICVKLGTMAESCLEGSTRITGAHGNHVQIGTCMFCQSVTSETTVTYSADCPTCTNVHTCNESRVEYGGEHGNHYKKTYCNICSKLQNTITVESIDTCRTCIAEGSGITEAQLAYQQGFEAGKKVGHEQGYWEGYAKGQSDDNYIGAGIRGMWQGATDAWLILANGIGIGGVTLGNVVTSVIIILVIALVVVVLVKK